MILKIPRCTLDIFIQILYDKTIDGGKKSLVLEWEGNDEK